MSLHEGCQIRDNDTQVGVATNSRCGAEQSVTLLCEQVGDDAECQPNAG